MQVSVETGEGLQRRMKVALPAEQIEAELDKRLKQMARTARLSGFRPGKVPLKLLRQRYEEQLRHEVVGDLVPSAFAEAVTQESLNLAGRPSIEPILSPEERQYGFTAVFEVFPEVELADLGGKTVQRPQVEVTDADVDEVVQRLREQRKSWQPVERPAQAKDSVVVDYQGRIDGAEFDGGTGSDVRVEIGSGRLMPGFEDGLVGASAGEQRILELSFPADHPNPELQGKAAQFAVTVKEVEEPVLPEVDAEFVRSFGIAEGEVEQLYRDVRENLERERRRRTGERVKAQVMDVLLEVHTLPIPESLVKEEVQSLKEQAREGLQGNPQIDLPDSLFEDTARRRVTLGLILREIVQRHEIEVDAERVRAAVEELAASYESPEEVIRYYYGDRKLLGSIESKVLEDQVVDWVLASLTVEEMPMSFEELASADAGAEA
ncbi:trigger factor [Thioflavicoccus mobilis 8321]|uniref:Trigger factor n=1 Tax=Thioflavicoccus mobilis 8321 TaxID=765912 RepID=L0GV95_9GAMM|nr:trigger factor [Thioflavicoccus mobilis]AGA89290.1 trigger factor [Thioflavicoccus mobilis 8321]